MKQNAAGAPRTIAPGIALMVCLLAGPAGAQSSSAPLGPPADFDPTWAAWSRVLNHAATPEGLRYDLILREDEDFNRQLLKLVGVTPGQFGGFTRDAQLAFLINVHNIFAVARVLEAYPIESIDRTVRFGSALNKRTIYVLNQRWSLRDLRERVMSDEYGDARALFLLNWAMEGCPPLPRIAVTEANLEELLEYQTRRFLSDARYNVHDPLTHRYYASNLLRIYRGAFRRDFVTLWAFIERYAPEGEAELLAQRRPKFKFQRFSTRLNAAPLVMEPVIPPVALQ